MHIVKEPFLATQFPGGDTFAIGIAFKALLNKAVYKFKLADDKETIYCFDVQEAIKTAKKYFQKNTRRLCNN